MRDIKGDKMITNVVKTQLMLSDPWEWSGMYKVTTDDPKRQEYWVMDGGCGMDGINQWVAKGNTIEEGDN
jgi:hypothetical protein